MSLHQLTVSLSDDSFHRSSWQAFPKAKVFHRRSCTRRSTIKSESSFVSLSSPLRESSISNGNTVLSSSASISSLTLIWTSTSSRSTLIRALRRARTSWSLCFLGWSTICSNWHLTPFFPAHPPLCRRNRPHPTFQQLPPRLIQLWHRHQTERKRCIRWRGMQTMRIFGNTCSHYEIKWVTKHRM